MAKLYGIAIGKDLELTNPQRLWDRGVRFVITEGSADNGMLRKVAGQCAYHGFKLGVMHTLRYPPMAGSVQTQVVEFYEAVKGLDVDMPYILNLAPFPGFPIPPDKTYQGMANTWLQDILSYFKGADRMIRVDHRLITNVSGAIGNLTSDQIPLWIYQPASGDVITRPFRTHYILRSFLSRDWDGNRVEPVEFAGDMVLFNNWVEEGKQTLSPGYFSGAVAPVVPPPVPVPPPPDVTSTKAKLDEIIRLATELKASL